MVKKVLCVTAAVILTILEHLCFGINPMDVLSTLVLAVGFTYTCDVFYMDFIEYCAKEIYDNPEKPEDIW